MSGRIAATIPLPEAASDVSDFMAEKSLVNDEAVRLDAPDVVVGVADSGVVPIEHAPDVGLRCHLLRLARVAVFIREVLPWA